MFSLGSSVKYWLYNKPAGMRKSFNGLSGIVTDGMCASLRSGDVYVFLNASRNMMKILHQGEGGLVLYAMLLFPTHRMCRRWNQIFFWIK